MMSHPRLISSESYTIFDMKIHSNATLYLEDSINYNMQMYANAKAAKTDK